MRSHREERNAKRAPIAAEENIRHLARNKDKARAASPVSHVTADDAPFLIMHGDHDLLVPHAQSVELNDALKKAGVETTLRTMEASGHGDGAFRTPEAFAAVREFFSRTLRKQ